MKKIMMSLIAVALMCTSSFAGEQPEFDTVYCDADNYFNDKVKEHVIANNVNFDGRLMNYYSDFSDYTITYLDENDEVVEIPAESFSQGAGQYKADPCFPDYYSHLVTAWNGAIFKWDIVLQKKPDTDLNITIRDCVLKMNSFEPFGTIGFAGASQTGRYVMPWGQVFWVLSANPTISAKAYPGEFASYGFEKPFTLDGRTQPGLTTVSLEDTYYTSKGMWEESIVVIMPEDGVNNLKGERQYRLKQGDMISVQIVVPEAANTVNVNYGEDNVALTYVGIHGTEYLHDNLCCRPNAGTSDE